MFSKRFGIFAFLLGLLTTAGAARAAVIKYPQNAPMFYSGDMASYAPQINGFTGLPGCTAGGLPPGMTINPESCIISGMVPPVGPTGQAFNVTVTSTQAPVVSLQLRVMPVGVVYSTTAPTFYSGDRISFIPRIAGYSGRIPDCRASGLPNGLNVDPSTCAIGGFAPLIAAPGFIYRVTVNAINLPQPVSLSLRVLPSGISYPTTQPVFYMGDNVNFIPRIVGFNGRPANCAASGLPPGLRMDPMTCAVNGSPQAIGTFQVNVTAEGVPPVRLSLSVQENSIVYPDNQPTFYSNELVNYVPRLVGFNGRNPNCVATNLPPGMRIDPVTCVINGNAPNLPPIGQIYNASISATMMPPIPLQIQILANDLIYPTLQPTFAPGDRVSLIPNVIGFRNYPGPNCSATGLPPGLMMDPFSCAITGTAPQIGNALGMLYTINVTALGMQTLYMQMLIQKAQ